MRAYTTLLPPAGKRSSAPFSTSGTGGKRTRSPVADQTHSAQSVHVSPRFAFTDVRPSIEPKKDAAEVALLRFKAEILIPCPPVAAVDRALADKEDDDRDTFQGG